MNTKKIIGKYAVILLIYVLITNLIQPYGLKLYFSIVSNPQMTANSVNLISNLILTVRFVLSLIIILFVLIDSKQKVFIDWLIVIIILFSAEIGILLFLIWQIYKSMTIKHDA
jgi:hypothetical protein